MKRVGTGLIALLPFVAAPALAAPPAFTWTGFYFGVNGGYGGAPWAAHDAQISGANPFVSIDQRYGVARASGFIFGGQIGYNYRLENRVVVGVESDMQWSDIRRSSQTAAVIPGLGLASIDSSRAALDWFGTTRLRVGYAVGRFFPYATAGVAYGGLSAGLDGAGSLGFLGLNRATNNSTSATRLGWAAGAGGEYALTGNLSLRTEWLYTEFGGLSGPVFAVYPALFQPPFGMVRPPAWGGGVYAGDRAGFHVVRAGLNYRFVGGGSGFEAPSFVVPGVDPRDWSGFYVGANAGYGGGLIDVREQFARLFAPAAAGGVSTRAAGFLAGVQAGYNHQLANSFVVGVETDAQWSDIRWSGVGARQSVSPAPLFASVDPGNGASGAISWFGTTRLRLGYALDRVMPFVTGGVAYGEISAASRIGTVSSFPAFDSYLASASGVRAGWTAGAGLEYALTNSLSLKSEYDYLEFGGVGGYGSGLYSAGLLAAAPSVGTLSTGSVGLHMVRAGLNWRLEQMPF